MVRVIPLSYYTHLKANILIDGTGCARLADFGLLTIISDPANFLSSGSYTQGGTARWMSPERIVPQEFGLKDSRPTVSSDCYSLGMVIYETISGNPPFHEYADITVFMKVLKGEHPSRGMEFTERLWEMLEMCWTFQPNNRPRIEDVLKCMDTVSISLGSPSPGASEEMEKDDDESAGGSSGIPNEMSNTKTTDSTTTPPDSSYVTDAPLRAASAVSGSSVIEPHNPTTWVSPRLSPRRFLILTTSIVLPELMVPGTILTSRCLRRAGPFLSNQFYAVAEPSLTGIGRRVLFPLASPTTKLRLKRSPTSARRHQFFAGWETAVIGTRIQSQSNCTGMATSGIVTFTYVRTKRAPVLL